MTYSTGAMRKARTPPGTLAGPQAPYSVPDSGDLMGPTGRVWRTANGPPATEINATVGLDNKFYNIPTLTPNQINIQKLLNRGKPSPRQLRTAIQYAQQNNLLQNGYANEPLALEAEMARHQLLSQKFANWKWGN